MPITFRALMIHGSLFVLTFCTVTLAGVQWLNLDPLALENFGMGLPYGVLVMGFLFSHEMGHYLMARYHRVASTLPYFLPFPAFLGLQPFGTFGAVIRLASPVTTRKALFDIGVAGPIAGFVVSFVTLVVGFRTLPSIDFLYSVHPAYMTLPGIPETGERFGQSVLYALLAKTLPPARSFVPPMNEMYHYPFLCAGWFGLFVTAMNLLPVGQLDGGHIARVLFPNHFNRIGQGTLIGLMMLGTLGVLPLVGIETGFGWMGWLFWALVLALLLRRGRFAQGELDDEPLGIGRQLLGWLCMAILLLSFIPVPMVG
jgi:membrane-associated protease RseP (regulator of RpoE activity)